LSLNFPKDPNSLHQVRVENAYAQANALSFTRECSRIFDTATKLFHDPEHRLQPSSPAFLLKDIFEKQVILLGEEHNHPMHSASELALLKALRELAEQRGLPLTLGLEMFEHTKDHKAALNDFIFGEDDVPRLKHRTQWDERWGWPMHGKSKLLNYAKTHKIPVFGCNAPVELTRLVEKRGIADLIGRPGIPAVDLSNVAHRERFFAERQSSAAAVATSERELQNAYEAQTLREEWMAGSAAAHARERQGIVLLILGRNHVAGRAGVPSRTHQRLSGWASPSTILMRGAKWNLKKQAVPITPGVSLPSTAEADWIWFVEHKKGCPIK